MVARSQRYDMLARLLDYPEKGGYPDALAHGIDLLEGGYADAAELLRPLHERVRGMGDGEIQELYTRTFDINAVCTLEIGWHVYGEDYARGALLVKLRERLRSLNVPESCELPDHLTHVLMVLGRIPDDEGDELAARYLLPGLDKMLNGMAEGEQPYRALIEAVSTVVRTDHDVEVVVPREPRSDPPDSNNRLPVLGTPGCGRREAGTP